MKTANEILSTLNKISVEKLNYWLENVGKKDFHSPELNMLSVQLFELNEEIFYEAQIIKKVELEKEWSNLKNKIQTKIELFKAASTSDSREKEAWSDVAEKFSELLNIQEQINLAEANYSANRRVLYLTNTKTAEESALKSTLEKINSSLEILYNLRAKEVALKKAIKNNRKHYVSSAFAPIVQSCLEAFSEFSAKSFSNGENSREAMHNLMRSNDATKVCLVETEDKLLSLGKVLEKRGRDKAQQLSLTELIRYVGVNEPLETKQSKKIKELQQNRDRYFKFCSENNTSYAVEANNDSCFRLVVEYCQLFKKNEKQKAIRLLIDNLNESQKQGLISRLEQPVSEVTFRNIKEEIKLSVEEVDTFNDFKPQLLTSLQQKTNKWSLSSLFACFGMPWRTKQKKDTSLPQAAIHEDALEVKVMSTPAK